MAEIIKIDIKVYEKLITDFIKTNDIRKLVEKFSINRVFYYCVLKDITDGKNSPNYPIFSRIAQQKKVSESFIIDQAKSMINYLAPYEQPGLDNYYEILGVDRNATEEQVRKKWISLMKFHHPDMAGEKESERAKKINEAYEVLGNLRKRTKYDEVHMPHLPVRVIQKSHPARYYALPFVILVLAGSAYLAGSGVLFKSEEEKQGVVESLNIKPVGEIYSDGETEKQVEKILAEKNVDNNEAVRSATDEKNWREEDSTYDLPLSSEGQPLGNVPEQEDVIAEPETGEAIIAADADRHDTESQEQELEVEEELGRYLDEARSEAGPGDAEVYTVREGDNVYNIARNHGITSEELLTYNNRNTSKLAIGDKLLIPVDDGRHSRAEETARDQTESETDTETGMDEESEAFTDADDVTDNTEPVDSENNTVESDATETTALQTETGAIEDEPAVTEKSDQVLPVVAGAETKSMKDEPEQKTQSDVHTGIPGDKETAAVETEVLETVRASESDNAGEDAVVAGADEDTAGSASQNVDQAESHEKEAPGVDTDSNVYVVKKGDNPWTIAKSHGVPVKALLAHNNKTDSSLDVGERLLVPSPEDIEAQKEADEILNARKTAEMEAARAVIAERITEEIAMPDRTTARTDEKTDESKTITAVTDEESEYAETVVPASTNDKLGTKPDTTVPDKASLYTFASDYVSAYRNKNLSRIRSFFISDATENGTPIVSVFPAYKTNFDNTVFKKYDIKITTAEINDRGGYVKGNFVIRFLDHTTRQVKESTGQIAWKLIWVDDKWMVEELNYNIQKVVSID